MKSSLVQILILLAAFLVLSSRSCVPDPPDEGISDQTARHDSLITEFREQFGADYLMDEQLMFYSDKAKQKLQDFIDLLNLYNDPEMDTVFRSQARIALMKVFSENESPLYFQPAGKGTSAISAHLWNDKVEKHPDARIQYSVGELRVVEPFRAVDPVMYKGSLSAKFRVTGLSGKDTVYTEESDRMVGMVVTRIKKSFGNDTYEDVWQVFLMSIY